MKKKTLLLTTLAGSMLIAGMAMPTTNAVTNNTAIVNEDKEIVAVELANKDTQISKDELKNLIAKAYEGKNLKPEITVEGDVKTGSTVKVGENKTLTVVLYGDVTGEGDIDSDDAQAIADYATGKNTLSEAALIAAEVAEDNAIDSDDAQRVSDFKTGFAKTLLDSGKSIEEKINPEQEVPVTQYSFTVNTNNIINNVNVGTTKLELVEAAAEAKTNLKLVVYDKNGAKPVTYTNVSLVKDSKDITLGLDVTPSGAKLDDVLDGTLSFELYEIDEENDKETLVGKQTVVKNTVAPELVQVSAVRKETNTATLKGVRFGESDIKTVYYCAVPMTEEGKPTWNPTGNDAKTFGDTGSFKPTTKKIEMSGKDSFEETITGLEPLTAYKVYYVLENKYGSQSQATTAQASKEVDLSKAINLKKATKVTSTTIEFDKKAKKFKWNDPTSSNKFIVTLYKDGKIIEEKEVDTATTGYNLPENIEAGIYYIEVVTKGSITAEGANDKLNSDAVRSKTVTVKDIAKVSGIKLGVNTDNGYPELSWTENDKNCGGYTVNLYRKDTETGVFTDARVFTTDVADNKSIYYPLDSSGDIKVEYKKEGWTGENPLGRNRGYYVEVIANVDVAKTTAESEKNKEENIIYVNSQPEYYYFCAPYRNAEITNASDSTMTFKLDTTQTGTPYYANECAYGEKESDLTYAVRVYEKSEEKDIDMGTKEVTVTYDYDENDPEKITATYFTVNGLKANTEYKFRLITKCGEFEGWSKQIENGHTMPRIENLTCATESDAQGENSSKKFYAKDNEKLIIAGTEYKANDYKDTKLKEEFVYLVKFLATLKEGDKVTIEGNTVDLTLSQTENENAIDLSSTYLTDKVVNLTGTGHERAISGTVVSELHLKAGQFNISGVNLSSKSDDKEDGLIVLENGVTVKASGETSDLTVKPGTVTINNVKMTTQLETVVKTEEAEDAQILVVVANGEKSNNLTFESIYDSVNEKENKNATIKFVSADENAAVQQGTITIKCEGGKVTVTQDKVTIGSNITVTVEKGEVDVSESTLTGSKAVTLSGNESKSITALAANAVPQVLKGKTVEIKAYDTPEALKKALNDNVSAGYAITDAVVSEVNTWLATFGISDKEAKVTVDSTSDKVTITYSGSETLTVQGLK